jgi:ABC-2 type transport system permease protein
MVTLTITKRELGAYFKSPIAYVVLSAFVGLTGFLFFKDFFLVGNASMEGFFGSMPFLCLFFAPAVAMRLVAEERNTGTLEMLLTMPVRDHQVVLGKFLAAVGVMSVGILLTLPFALSVGAIGQLDPGPVIAGYVGAILLNASYLSIGLFASALTRDQIVAFVLGFGICLGFALLGAFQLGPVFQYLSPQYHFSKIARGVIELRNIVYYLSLITVFLLLTQQVLESRKWR